MTMGSLVVLVGRAAVFGLLLALPLSDGELVSVQIWLAVTAVLLAVGLLRQVIRVASVEPAKMAVASPKALWQATGNSQVKIY